MSSLKDIAHRHGRDRWKDILFVGAAVLLTALSIGSVTSKAAGSAAEKTWQLSVVESPVEVVR